MSSEFPTRPSDPAGCDWLTDVVVEHLEDYYGAAPVAVEYAVVCRTLAADGTVCTGALAPLGQGVTATTGLLADLAPDVASRLGGEVFGNE